MHLENPPEQREIILSHLFRLDSAALFYSPPFYR